MKRLISFLPVVVLTMILFGCEGERTIVNPPDQVTITDDNQDNVWHAGPEDGLLGNVDVWFIPGTMQGSAIWVINGPGSAIGFDVTSSENRSVIYFGEGYTGAGNHEAQTGTTIPRNQWLYIRVVVYNGLASAFAVFLESLGQGFFDSVEDIWIQEVFEAEVWLGDSGQLETRCHGDVTSEYLDQ